jgi:hypothetical protein
MYLLALGGNKPFEVTKCSIRQLASLYGRAIIIPLPSGLSMNLNL